jgi:ornithine--oxo-acid transaminase
VVKGIPEGRQHIIACENNFHGRTISIVSFSSHEEYRAGFGPFTPGFTLVPFGDAEALERAITPDTCAFLVEPIQGEAGIVVPPRGYLKRAEEICRKHNVLLIVDEIQSGLGRAGAMFAYQLERVQPDAITIGKALSGGFYPVSALLARREVMGVFKPGEHGSTFGGNPLEVRRRDRRARRHRRRAPARRAAQLGAYFMGLLRDRQPGHPRGSRQRQWIGLQLHEPARRYCEALMARGVLCKETHDTVMRIAPPLVITRDEIDWAFDQIRNVLERR